MTRVRRPFLGQRLGREPPQPGGERLRLPGQVHGVAVGAALQPPRQEVGQRGQQQQGGPGRQHRDRQPRHVRDPCQPQPRPEAVQRPLRRAARQRRRQRLARHRLPHVAVHVVGQLVRHDDLDLVVAVVGQQGVRQQHAARRADADQGRVRPRGIGAQAPLVNADRGRAGTPDERLETPPQRRALQRPEVIEPGQDERREMGGRDRQDRRRQAGGQPPRRGPAAHGGIQEHRAGRPRRHAHDGGARVPAQPVAGTPARDAEAAIEDELPVPGQRQVDGPAGERHDERVARHDQRGLQQVGHRRQRRRPRGSLGERARQPGSGQRRQQRGPGAGPQDGGAPPPPPIPRGLGFVHGGRSRRSSGKRTPLLS